jgi:hypothetical protein
VAALNQPAALGRASGPQRGKPDQQDPPCPPHGVGATGRAAAFPWSPHGVGATVCAAVKVRTVNTLDQWTETACAELGLDRREVDITAVLDLARDVAHSVARPAAPLTAFLLGLAVGRGQQVEQAAQRLRALAQRWEADS